MNKKSLKVFSIGAILGSMMQIGIPISAEAAVDSYIIKVSQEVYSYNKNQLNEDFLNFKEGETSKLYNDFIIKLKMAKGFYAFHDKKTGYIKYEDIENKYLESKLKEKKFNVEEFTESKECKIIEVNWIKKAIVTIEGTVKYITPDDDSKNSSEDTREVAKQSGSTSKHNHKHNSKDSTSKIEKEKDKAEKQKQEKLAEEKAKAEKERLAKIEADKQKTEAEKQNTDELKKQEELKQQQEEAKIKAEKEKQEKLAEEKAKAEKERLAKIEADKQKAESEKQKANELKKQEELKQQQEEAKIKAEKEKQEKLAEEKAKAEKERLAKIEADKQKTEVEKQKEDELKKQEELKQQQEEAKKQKLEKEQIAELLKNDKKIEINQPEKFDIVIKEAVKQLKSQFTVVVPYREYKKYNFDNFNNIMVQLGGEDYGKPGANSEVGVNLTSDYKVPITVNINYKRDIDEVKNQKQATEAEVKRIVKEVIKDDMAPVEKELILHDYVVKHADYNMDGLNKKPADLEDHSAYGVLVLGKGVCESYAKAMHLLLNEAGVECKYVTGYKKNSDGTQGGGHAWNIVKLDNEWYNLDATWDDPVSDRVGRNDKDIVVSPVIHTYFNVTDDIFNKDHIRGEYEKKNYPKCTGVKYNYENMDIPEYTSDGQLIEKVTSVDELDNKILTILQCKKTNSVLKLKNINMDLNQLKNEVSKVVNDNKLNIGFSASYGLQENYFSCQFKFS